jgi:hypothetical protein
VQARPAGDDGETDRLTVPKEPLGGTIEMSDVAEEPEFTTRFELPIEMLKS